jgi:hypothetical protein
MHRAYKLWRKLCRLTLSQQPPVLRAFGRDKNLVINTHCLVAEYHVQATTQLATLALPSHHSIMPLLSCLLGMAAMRGL